MSGYFEICSVFIWFQPLYPVISRTSRDFKICCALSRIPKLYSLTYWYNFILSLTWYRFVLSEATMKIFTPSEEKPHDLDLAVFLLI